MKRKLEIMVTVSIILLVLWIPSALDKILNFPSFKEGLLKQPFPDGIGTALAYGLPTMELVIGILLATQRFMSIAFGISILLLAMYSNYVGMAIFLGAKSYLCKCSLLIEKLDWSDQLYFNLVFLGISIVGYYLQKKQRSDSSRQVIAEGVSATRQHI